MSKRKRLVALAKPSVLFLAANDSTDSSSDEDDTHVYTAKFTELFTVPAKIPKVTSYVDTTVRHYSELEALGLVLYVNDYVYGVRIPDVVLTPSILPTDEHCSNLREQATYDGMLGQLELLGCAPPGSAPGRTTASISSAYRYGATPHTGIGHGGTARMMTSNPLVFFVQALGLVLYVNDYVYGVRIPDVVLTPSILPTDERSSDPREQATYDGMLGQLEFLGCA
ncbi:hypothetical protein V5799_012488 [Amblyomma americanum]|uniref:Uncharacterized protein n=1 Tax=Amblyomma americanum TaxID=6943 RepID=A0AAQ4EDX6_AMBAM